MRLNKGSLIIPHPELTCRQYVESIGSKKLEVFNPKDGSLVADDVPLATERDVDLAVANAEAAFPSWKKTLPSVRRTCLLKLADLLEENMDTLAELTRITLGSPYGTLGVAEKNMALEMLRYYAGWADKFSGEAHTQEDGVMKIVRNEPLGVTVGIIPWNAPLISSMIKLGPAIITGNCFIMKPSEKTPFAALALGSLIKEAGFPPGVIQVLSGDGSTGALLASHMRVRKVSFTGSVNTGRKIQEMASKSNLKRVSLELGGKSPAIVFDDCNFENAIHWCALGITVNSGQGCIATSRVYVQDTIYPKFLAAFKAAMEARLKVMGDPDDSNVFFGPMVDKAQYERVKGFIERGKSQGQLLTGGTDVSQKVGEFNKILLKIFRP